MNDINLNNEQRLALEAMLAGENIFLTGEAGSGKTAVLQAFRARCNRDTVFLAPTGLVAHNIGGQTIHSFFRLKPGLQIPESMDETSDCKLQTLLANLRTIVIDEVSMVRSDLFVAIDHRLRSVATGMQRALPFGGKQIILIGDFLQLPPVITDEREERYLKVRLGGIYPFQTRLWCDAGVRSFVLHHGLRQSGDSLFLSILRNIRYGVLDNQIKLPGMTRSVNSIEALNICCHGHQLPVKAEPVCLCATKREATVHNSTQMTRLQGERFIFHAQSCGIFQEADYPTDGILEVRIGARVMAVVNKRRADGSFEYINGDVGSVVDVDVRKDGSGTVVVKFDDGRISAVERYHWSKYRYEVEIDRNTGEQILRQVEIGSFTQVPLRLAYAITIHKAQGLEFDSVRIRLGSGCFAAGQLYTALSRCRNLNRMQLDRCICKEDLVCDSDVVAFYQSIDGETQNSEPEDTTPILISA